LLKHNFSLIWYIQKIFITDHNLYFMLYSRTFYIPIETLLSHKKQNATLQNSESKAFFESKTLSALNLSKALTAVFPFV